MDVQGDVKLLQHYFPNLTPIQIAQYRALGRQYLAWNKKINLISRKDIANLYPSHILHSLSIAKVIDFQEGATILDVGTGGGLPGIPLAILFPTVHFMLVDSVRKKIKAVTAIVEALGLNNVTPICGRAEEVEDRYDFVVSRAVTKLYVLYDWVKEKLKQEEYHAIPNGVLYLKGGDLAEELRDIDAGTHVYDLAPFFSMPFFEGKKLVHLFPLKSPCKGKPRALSPEK